MSAQHTILIVEDDPGFASYLERLLRRKDLRLITANGGQKAIQCLQANRVDLVLQDIGLPDIDGYQVMDLIRQEYPATLVIVMTGEITVESALKALRKGAYDYLRKPFESEQQNKQAEAKLGESEARYRQLFDSESDAVVVFDAETLQMEDVNQSALHLFGYSKKEFLGLIVLDISAETRKTRQKIELLNKDPSSNNQVPLRYLKKKDGSTFPAEISAGNFISNGRQKIIGTIRDITIRHRAEEELKQAKQRLQHVLTSSPTVICYLLLQSGRRLRHHVYQR
jgi:PAS domain S-box-containing protein